MEQKHHNIEDRCLIEAAVKDFVKDLKLLSQIDNGLYNYDNLDEPSIIQYGRQLVINNQLNKKLIKVLFNLLIEDR